MSDIVERLERYSIDAIAYSDLSVLESKCGRLGAATMMGKLETLLEKAADEITRLRAERDEAVKALAECRDALAMMTDPGSITGTTITHAYASAVAAHRTAAAIVKRLILTPR